MGVGHFQYQASSPKSTALESAVGMSSPAPVHIETRNHGKKPWISTCLGIYNCEKGFQQKT